LNAIHNRAGQLSMRRPVLWGVTIMSMTTEQIEIAEMNRSNIREARELVAEALSRLVGSSTDVQDEFSSEISSLRRVGNALEGD
jgi:hypothetical protein